MDDQRRVTSGGLASTTSFWGNFTPAPPRPRRPASFRRIPQLQPAQAFWFGAPREQRPHDASSFQLDDVDVPVDGTVSNSQRLAQHLAREFQFHSEVAFIVLKRQADRAWRCLSSVGALALVTKAESTEAQADLRVPHSATHLLRRAEDLQQRGDLRGAVALLQDAHALDPQNAGVLSFLSKQWTDHTYLPGISSAQVIDVNDRAIHFAMAAQQADPTFSLAHCAESICKGRKAVFEGNPRCKLQLAKEAQEAAYRALDINHGDDIAHHLIGRWNVGMAGLNFFVKACIKYVFGTDFRPGTMESALESYETAAALRPDRLIHRVELARCYQHFGRNDEAAEELKVCMGLPLEDVNARQMLEEGAKLLQQLDPTYVRERETAYASGTPAALRAVWPEFASALDDDGKLETIVAPAKMPLPQVPLASAA